MSMHVSGFGGSAASLEAFRQQRFSKADKDSDGKITKDELSAVIQNRKGHGPGVDRIFEKVDTNQDGAIDDAEDKAAFESMKGHRRHGPPDAARFAEELMKGLDADSDSKVTQEELANVLKVIGKEGKAEKLFKLLDADEDGSVTKSELETAVKSMFEQMKAKREEHRGGGEESCSCYNRSGNAAPSTTTEPTELNAVA